MKEEYKVFWPMKLRIIPLVMGSAQDPLSVIHSKRIAFTLLPYKEHRLLKMTSSLISSQEFIFLKDAV